MTPVRGRTLRARLTVLLVVVLLVATAVAGVATALALRIFLLGRLDAQLTAAGDRFAVSLETGDGDGDDVVPGQPVGTLGARLVGGRVSVAAVVVAGGRPVTASLSAADVRALAALPLGGAPRTVDLDRLHDYRLQAVAGRDGDVQVSGLPEAEVDATTRRLIAVEVVLFVGVIAVAAVVVALLVRRTLRPLHALADTARQVAALPLTAAAPTLPVPPAPADTTSEVGQVSAAFEQMLDHIRAALAARDATEERLRRFVADASHEFRTPLATVRAHSELVQRAPESLPPEVVRTLGHIDVATARMSALVEDLLLLARLDDAALTSASTTDLSRLVVEAAVEASALAPGHRWRLDLPDAPVEVGGPDEHWQRVVGNLLANARLHTPPGSTVQVVLVDGGHEATLTVADDGPGIPDTVRTSLFDRFTRGDASRASASGGSGLGLAIARGVVRAHDGTLAVDSEPGRTAFVVRVPVGARRVDPSPAEALETL